MRNQGKMRLGFFPLPLGEVERIRRFVQFPSPPCAAVDPCIGDGVAFRVLTADAEVLRYGIELDSYRAEQARGVVGSLIQGDTLETHCPVESLGLVFLNPPYDWISGQGRERRTEPVFLNHCYRWLKPGGILVLVIPGERLAEVSSILATQFRDARVYRLREPECVRYKQIVWFGVRRTRRERERLQDSDITRTRLQYAGMGRNGRELPVLPDVPDACYPVPESGPVQLVYIDPPYGIKYGSNFQPFVNKRDVKDGKDEDLTRSRR